MNIGKELMEEDRKKVGCYISAIKGYLKPEPGAVRTNYGTAVLALRMLWEVLYAYQNVNPKDGGRPVNRGGNEAENIIPKRGKPVRTTYELVSRLCHYQEGDEKRTAERRRQCFIDAFINSQETLRGLLNKYCCNGTLEEVDILSAFNTLCDDPDKCAKELPGEEENAAPTEHSMESYIDELCAELDMSSGFIKGHRILCMAFYERYIANTLLHSRLKSRYEDLKQGNKIDKTNLDDYVKELEQGRPGEGYGDASRTDKEYAYYGRIIFTNAGYSMHWTYSDGDETERVQEEEGSKLESCLPALSRILSLSVGDGHPEMANIIALINRYSRTPESDKLLTVMSANAERVSELEEEIKGLHKQERKDNLYFYIVVIASALFICLVVYLMILKPLYNSKRSSDPSPAIAEEENLTATGALDEIPTIAVRAGDAALADGQLTMLPYVPEQVGFRIEATCNAQQSLKWAQDERYMNSHGYKANSFGLSALRYQLFDSDSSGQRGGNYPCCSAPVEAGFAQFQYTLKPGWYVLRVQAVGAADGLVVDGNELQASTGWRSYPFLVLPEHADWSLHDVSRNTYTDGEEGLNVKAGDELELSCDTALQDGMCLYTRWDNEDEWTVSEHGSVTVPDADSGVYTLQARVSYANDVGEYATELNHEFHCAVEAKSVIDKNVQLAVRTADGKPVPNGTDVILTPGVKLQISASGRYGINHIYYEILEGEKVVASGSGETDYLELPTDDAAYGAEWGMRIDAVGNGNSGPDDTRNRAIAQFDIHFRTRADEYNADGKCTRKWLYDDAASSEPTGYISYEYEHAENGDELNTSSWWSADGEPVYESENSYHKIVYRYNDKGQWVETWLYDLDGESLMEDTKNYNGAAHIIMRYEDEDIPWEHDTDDLPQLHMEEYWQYDANGELRLNSLGWAGWKQWYDDAGRTYYEINYGADGEPAIRDKGYCILKTHYDENGNNDKWWLYDTDGETLIDSDYFGYASIEYTFDENGNKTSEIRYHADGSPVIIDGYAKWEAQYYPDKDNKLHWRRYLDAEGHRVNHAELLYAQVEEKYEQKNLTERKFTDASGNLVVSSDGYARLVMTYDPMVPDSPETEAYYDTEGQLIVPGGQDWAMRRNVYRGGKLAEVHYYGVDGAYVGVDELSGAATEEYDYDADGNMSYRMYRDADGEPFTPSHVNYCGNRYVYEPGSNGRVRYTYYLSEDAEMIVNETGFYVAKVTMNEHGQYISEERMMQDGSAPGGDAVQRLEWSFFSEDEGSPVREEIEYREPREGEISKTRREYAIDPWNEVYLKSVSFYDGNDAPVEDEQGIWMYSYDRQLRSSEGNEGRASTQDSEIMVYTEAYLDAAGRPTSGPYGYAHKEYEAGWDAIYDYIMEPYVSNGELGYDPAIYEERYYGTEGLPMLNHGAGYCMYRRTASATQSTEEFFDTQGKLMNSELTGFARAVSEYEDGQLVSFTAYDAEGNEVEMS